MRQRPHDKNLRRRSALKIYALLSIGRLANVSVWLALVFIGTRLNGSVCFADSNPANGLQKPASAPATQQLGNSRPTPGLPEAVADLRISAGELAQPGIAPVRSQTQAIAVLDQVIDGLANGPAFEAEIRQRVWASGHNVIGYGLYNQVGNGTGQFLLQLSMHDGKGKHTFQQISDGRLTWTRSQIGDQVQLKRIDIGWLEEGVRASGGPRALAKMSRTDQSPLAHGWTPKMKIGGWTEMLDRLRDDYVLRIGKSALAGQPLYVISGVLRDAKPAEIKQAAGGNWPPLFPSRVNVAVAVENQPETGFGKGIPLRIEFWSDPQTDTGDVDRFEQTQAKVQAPSAQHGGRMVSLIEIISPHPIEPPPVERFRFDNQDQSVDIVNETGRYEERFGIRVSAKELARQRW